jgi:hypothetical protein
MTTATKNWTVQKRVANTETWAVVGHATSREAAIAIARNVCGGKSTGVRVCRADDPDATPEIILGI